MPRPTRASVVDIAQGLLKTTVYITPIRQSHRKTVPITGWRTSMENEMGDMCSPQRFKPMD